MRTLVVSDVSPRFITQNSTKIMTKFIIFFGIILLLIAILVCFITNPLFPESKLIKSSMFANKDRMYQDVEFLTTLTPARNYKNLVSLNAAADYIKNEFEKLEDARVSFQEYQVEGRTYKNVIASFGSEEAERLIVGAHYDVCGDQAGADDNASAVAGLLETARILNSQKPELAYRIDFVAYSLEEPPYFRTEHMGSAVHARSLKAANVQVKGMICLEMLGYYSDEKDSQEFPISAMKLLYPSTGNFIAVIGKLGQGKIVRQIKRRMTKIQNVPVYSINAPASMPGIDFSDHQNYWKEGYKAAMICNTAFYRNKHYHQKTDTIETLDFNRMTQVVKGIYWAVINFK